MPDEERKWQMSRTPPEKTGAYLIYAPSANPNAPLIMVVDYHPVHGWTGLPSVWVRAITHWMPLPKPPMMVGPVSEPCEFCGCRRCYAPGPDCFQPEWHLGTILQ